MVLDPFLGSGTTSLAAAQEGRNSVGYEINAAFEPIIGRKLARGLDSSASPKAEPWELQVLSRVRE